MKTENEKLNEILITTIGSGELIYKNRANPNAGSEFLIWIRKVHDIVYNLITDRFLQFESRSILGDQLGNTNSVGGSELSPRLLKLLDGLRLIKDKNQNIIDLSTNKEEQNTNLIIKIKKGSKLRTTFDEYELIEQIGQGGAGTVFKAKNSNSNELAIKVLRPNIPIEKTKRFKNEISFCQNNEHAGIIKVIDHGIVESSNGITLFYVMPLYHNTYRDFINKSTSCDEKFKSLQKILDGIEAAHLRQCFHRDIKPENILINKERTNFIISDFGIAHFEEDDIITAIETSHQTRLANFQYASPEQRIKGGKVNHLSDIYSLGLIINEVFTKTIPVGTNYKTIESISPEFKYLDPIVEKMIDQDPRNRIQTIALLKSEIFKYSKQNISFQKLNQLKSRVIDENDISEIPLIKKPVKIVNVDHNGEKLICTLNHRIPKDWENLFYSRGASSWTSMHHPEMLTFKGDEVYMSTPIQTAPAAKSHIDEWIKSTNTLFQQLTQKNATLEASNKRERLKAEAEFEVERQEFLAKINL